MLFLSHLEQKNAKHQGMTFLILTAILAAIFIFQAYSRE